MDLLQLHIGQRDDLQNHTLYNYVSDVCLSILDSKTSAQAFTRSAFLKAVLKIKKLLCTKSMQETF